EHVRLPRDDDPDRAHEVQHVAAGEDQPRDVAREQQAHARHRAREVEIDRALLLHARHEVRGGEDREEGADEVEEDREAGLESEDELLDADLVVAAHRHFFAEQLRAGERAVDDVEVDRGGEDDDEQRGEEKVSDERPPRRGFAHHVFDVGYEDFHWTETSSARIRSTNTSSSVERTGVSSFSIPPPARRRSTSALRCCTSVTERTMCPFTRSTPAPVSRNAARRLSSTGVATILYVACLRVSSSTEPNAATLPLRSMATRSQVSSISERRCELSSTAVPLLASSRRRSRISRRPTE